MQHADEKALYKYLNLGCEMIFILDQRLRDAKITQEKKEKVMNTIWGRFISEDEFYRLNEVDFKSQFSRIAQSSIMKLNESSMSKLYDLMLMGLKYQCFHSHHPDELYLVLLNHFSGIYDIYREISANTAREIKIFFHQQINPRFLKLSTYQWLRLRRRVLNDYQNARIRISMFLRNKVQTEDSAFKLFPNKRLSQEFSNPGKTVSQHNTIEWKPSGENMITTDKSENSLEFDEARKFVHGSNIYVQPNILTNSDNGAGEVTKTNVLKEEMDMMSSLLGFEEINLDNGDITFSILSGESSTQSTERKSVPTVDHMAKTVNATADAKNVKNLMSQFQSLNITSKKPLSDDDLLSMMDAV